MAQQQTLWEHQEAVESKPDAVAQAERQRTKRATIKKLRASGHWLLLLRVARTIPQPFTLNDISVAVWRAHPEFFGMKGYPYPDNHKVHYILYGTRGLIAKGIVKPRTRGHLSRGRGDEQRGAIVREHGQQRTLMIVARNQLLTRTRPSARKRIVTSRRPP